MTEFQFQAVELETPEKVIEQITSLERQANLPEDATLSLRSTFADYYAEITDWREKCAMITNQEDETNQKVARDIRLGLRKVRCKVENVRKDLKAESLRRGRAIDGMAHILEDLCAPVEARLLEIEQYAELQEKARVTAIVDERTAQLAELEADPTAYNLGAMDQSTFDLVLGGIRKAKADREETERKAEADRIEREAKERAENERVRAENERLKKEAEANAEVEKMEQAKRDAKTAKIEAEHKAERAEAKANAKAESDAIEAKTRKEREDAAAKLKAEREAREKLEREAAETARIEGERIAAEKAEQEAKAKAPDKDKIVDFAEQVRNLEVPQMETDTGKDAKTKIDEKIKAFSEWIMNIAEEM